LISTIATLNLAIAEAASNGGCSHSRERIRSR
jgi:hypothetical protein